MGNTILLDRHHVNPIIIANNIDVTQFDNQQHEIYSEQLASSKVEKRNTSTKRSVRMLNADERSSGFVSFNSTIFSREEEEDDEAVDDDAASSSSGTTHNENDNNDTKDHRHYPLDDENKDLIIADLQAQIKGLKRLVASQSQILKKNQESTLNQVVPPLTDTTDEPLSSHMDPPALAQSPSTAALPITQAFILIVSTVLGSITSWLINRIEPKSTIADIGLQMEAEYDKKLKRWIFPGDDLVETVKPLPPPPTAIPKVADMTINTSKVTKKQDRDAKYDPLAALMAPPPIRSGRSGMGGALLGRRYPGMGDTAATNKYGPHPLGSGPPPIKMMPHIMMAGSPEAGAGGAAPHAVCAIPPKHTVLQPKPSMSKKAKEKTTAEAN